LVVTLLIAIGCVVVLLVGVKVPARHASGWRNGSATLKMIAIAEAEFRSMDRDGNGVNDFWTADVFGLYGLIPVAAGSNKLPADSTSAASIIRLIEPSVAGADGQSRTAEYGKIPISASIVCGSAKAGYLYRMFGWQDDGACAVPLQLDTDGDDAYYGAVHHRNRFAVMAFPEMLEYRDHLLVISADNTIWHYKLPTSYHVKYIPMQGTQDSASLVLGTGQSCFDAVHVFPVYPATVGATKME
jgi:hypothetical protein